MKTFPSTTRPVGDRKRHPLLALAAGLLMPGLGQLYGGDLVSGGLVLLAVALSVPFAAHLALWAPPRSLCFILFAGVGAAVAIYLGAAYRAFRRVRGGLGRGGQPWQRMGVYVLYVVVAYRFVLEPATTHVRDQLVETFVVPSASMMPTIVPGDRILVDKTVGRRNGQRLQRGAIAVFVYPNDRTSLFIKRIVGLPGDRISTDGRRLLVNGNAITSEGDASSPIVRERGDRGEYEVLWPAEQAMITGHEATEPPFVVPNGHVFVMGDNRAAAVDSRRFGAIPLSDVAGVARQVWFSSGNGEGVRCRRVGKVLK